MTPDTLQREQAFLLRSLDDLEAERAAGDLDDEIYERLRDDYTARAAAVARALAGGASASPIAGPRRRRGLVIAGVVVFSLVAGGLVATSLGQRLPGQTVTGNAQSDPATALREMARSVAQSPADADLRLSYARLLLQADRPVDALKQFDAAARLDPGNGEARAYAGWLVFLAGLTDEGLRRLDAAVAAVPSYPDGHLFRGMALLRGRGDRAGAAAELDTYLTMAPDGPMADQVRALLQEARGAPAGTTTTAPSP